MKLGRCDGCKDPVAEVVHGLDHAVLVGDHGGLDGIAGALLQNGGTVGEARIGAHQTVIADNVGLAGLAQTGKGTGYSIQPADRHLENENAGPVAAIIENGSRDEAGRCVVAGRVRCEVDKGDFRGRQRRRLAIDVPEVGVTVRTAHQVGGKVGLLEDRVDEVAIRVEQEDVIIAPRPQKAAEPRMKCCVSSAVGGAVTGSVQVFAFTDRMRVFGDIGALQVCRGVLTQRAPGGIERIERCQRVRIARDGRDVLIDGFQIVGDLVGPCVRDGIEPGFCGLFGGFLTAPHGCRSENDTQCDTTHKTDKPEFHGNAESGKHGELRYLRRPRIELPNVKSNLRLKP